MQEPTTIKILLDLGLVQVLKLPFWMPGFDLHGSFHETLHGRHSEEMELEH